MQIRSVVRGLAAGAAAIFLVTACKDDRASVFQPFGRPGYIMRLSAATARNFPTATSSLETLDTTATVPAVTTVATSRLVVTLTNLKALGAGKVYRVWLVDSTGTVFRLARGQVVRTQIDTVAGVATTIVDSSYTGLAQIKGGGRANVSFRLRLRKGLLGPNLRSDSAPYTQVMITISDSTDTDTTGGGGWRPFGRRIRNNGTATSTTNGTMTFGNYNPVTITTPFAYFTAGTGTGVGEIRDSEITVDFTQLYRPPQGYTYRLHVVGKDSSSYLVAGLTAPFPRRSVSLDPADTAQVDEVVTPTGIRASNARNFAGAIGLAPDPLTGSGWYKYAVRIYLTLEPKDSDLSIRGPSLVNSAAVSPAVYSEP